MIDLKRRGCASTKNEKTDFTTKHTKATKVSDIDIFKLLNFVIFVTYFENTRLGMRTKRPAWVPSYPRIRQRTDQPQAEAGIQANSAQQTWIPACAGMTSRGGPHVERNPSIFILGGRA